jgi:hypothetical protein
MLEEARKHPSIVVLGEAQPWLFDAAGNFSDLGAWHRHAECSASPEAAVMQ